MHRSLHWFGFHLANSGRGRQITDVDVKHAVFIAQFHDARCLVIKNVLVFAGRAAQLHHHHVSVHLLPGALNAVNDFVAEMRNSLHVLALIAKRALARDYGLINLAHGNKIVAGKRHIQKPLISAHVLVSLNAVITDKNLAVFRGADGAGVNIKVIFAFHRADAITFALQNLGQRRGRNALAHRGHNAAGDENIFGFGHVEKLQVTSFKLQDGQSKITS